ncbi:MAG: peptidoglycan DD-metalloendopeptidase family protein [Hyphomonadaceae bacterium]
MRRFVALLLLVLPLAADPARGQAADTFTVEDLKRVEAQRDAALARLKRLEASADTADREMGDIDRDLLSAAADSRRQEESARAAEARLVLLEADLKVAERRLAEDVASREDLLAALMSLSAHRPPALAASPDDAGSAVRAAILMSEAAPALAKRADDLRGKIVELNRIRTETTRERDRLEVAERALSARKDEIEALADSKRIARSSLENETAGLRAKSEALAREADTLRDLLDALAAEAPRAPGRKPAQPKPAASSPKSSPNVRTPLPGGGPGAPTPPVVGDIRVKYGARVNGERQEGLTLTTRPDSLVVAPRDGRIEFAGPFRSYGDMLILDVGGGVLVVMSGLDVIYAETGQLVLAGEPLGRMASRSSPAPELYLEVRRNGEPTDPAAWLSRGT